MRRSFPGRVIPAALTAAGVALPSATAALVLLHAMVAGSRASSSPSSSSSGTSLAAVVSSTPKPTATAHATARTQAAATPTPRSTAVTARTIAGPAIYDQYGEVQAIITVTENKITNVSITAPENDPRSAAINQQAVPLLQSETLQAQNANVDVISGATDTSQAYLQSLQNALQRARL